MRQALLLLALDCCAIAQTADSSLTFEAASVKVTGAAESAAFSARKSAAGSASVGADPILFTRRRATLASLLMGAYALKPQQVVGPDWLTTERYDIMARVDDATMPQQMIMLQNLLAEWFHLKQHREQRELPVYEMVVAKGGLKLKQPAETRVATLTPDGPFGLGLKDGVTMIHLSGRGSLDVLAVRLSRQADRMIVNRTGLTGEYDIDVRWSADASAPSIGDGAADPGISLPAAMESQLGLKLQPKKAPVEVMVIDNAEKVPTEN